MRVLAIDSSGACASAALLCGGEVRASSFLNCGLTHSQTLAPMVADMLRGAGISADEIDMIGAAAGPGSFTGLRIGLALVKGLAFERDIPCVGISTLEMLAACAPRACPETGGGIVGAAMDARAARVYMALFAREDGALRRLCEDAAVPLDDLPEKVRAFCAASPVLWVGDGAALCNNRCGDAGLPALALPAGELAIPAVAAARLAQRRFEAGEAVPPGRLRPIYLQQPQAERERLRRQPTMDN